MHAPEILIIAIFIGFVVWGWVFRPSKAMGILKEYLEKNRIDIIEIDHSFFKPRYWKLSSSTAQEWFHAKLRNEEGETVRTYIKVGHWLLGLLKPDIQIYEICEDGSLIDRTKKRSILEIIFPEARKRT